MRRNKRKIIAMLLFIFMSLFMFAFANPNGEIEQELLKPTMTLNETNIYQIEVHSKIPEFKAIAKDSNGKELKVDIKHNINNAVLGTYKVTFKAVDQFDNEEIIEREFKVVDTTRPVIRLIGRQLVKRLIDYETYTDEGANVTDNYDAPTTTRGIQRGTNTVAGIYTLRYNHTDSSGNRAFEVVRSIKMLAHNDDEDGDGYTNLEEYNEGTNYDDPLDHPDYDKAPTIILDENNIYSIEVYTDIPEFKATATDVADGVVPVIITHDINKDVVANTYKVTFRAVDSLGNVKEIIRDFEVTKRPITVKANDIATVYGEGIMPLSYSIILGSLNGSDGLNIGLSKPSGLDVGTYTITISESAANPNYNVTLVNGTYTITAKTLEESDLGEYVFNDGTFGYDGALHSIEVTGLPTWASVSYDDNTRLDAGTQVVTATITGLPNYSGSITATANLTVNKAPVTVTGNSGTKEYTGSDQTVTGYTTSGLLTGHVLSGLIASGTGKNVGNYPVTFTGTPVIMDESVDVTANYDITLTNGTLTITQVDPTYEIPTGLTGIINNNLSTVTLPSEWSWKEPNTVMSVLGNQVFKAIYTPSNTNYNSVEVNLTVYVKNKFTVNFIVDGTPIKTETVIEGNSANPPTNPTKTGFTFTDWDKEYNNITINLDVNAIFTINQYTITFNTNGGNTISPITQDYGTTITAPADPTRTNYEFVKWNPTIPATMPANNMTVEAEWNALQTGIRAEIKDNAQLLFTQDLNLKYDIKDYIEVYAVYADGTEVLVTDYTTNFTTANIGVNITLTINHNGFTNSNLKYTVIDDIAFQTKFEVFFNPITPYGYRKTINSNCTKDCDSNSKTKFESTSYNFLEIVEHYAEIINVTKVKVNFTNAASETLDRTGKVRWSRYKDGGYWDPVYIATTERGTSYFDNVPDNLIDENHILDTVEITYDRADHGTFTIIFKYNSSTGKLTAISETQH